MKLSDASGHIRPEDSALGGLKKTMQADAALQVAELKRIADAAELRAQLAVKQAQEAEAKAAEYEQKSRRSAIFSVLSAAGTFLMWIFTREQAISLLRKGYELLSQGLKLLFQG